MLLQLFETLIFLLADNNNAFKVLKGKTRQNIVCATYKMVD